MSRFSMEMNTSSAASFGGCFAAAVTSLLLMFAGIAVAVPVVFFAEAALAVRLCFGLILLVIGFCSVILPAPAKAPMR